MINEVIIVAGLIGAIIWNLVTWVVRHASSSSHALIGGIIGAVIISVGVSALNGWASSRSCCRSSYRLSRPWPSATSS